MSRPYAYGLIMEQERIEGVQRVATDAERDTIEAYRESYRRDFGRWPHGLHYIVFPELTDTVAVWLGPVDG